MYTHACGRCIPGIISGELSQYPGRPLSVRTLEAFHGIGRFDKCTVLANWKACVLYYCQYISLIARFMGPTWGPPGADRTQVGPRWATWTLLSGMSYSWALWLEHWTSISVIEIMDKSLSKIRSGNNFILHNGVVYSWRLFRWSYTGSHIPYTLCNSMNFLSLRFLFQRTKEFLIWDPFY